MCRLIHIAKIQDDGGSLPKLKIESIKLIPCDKCHLDIERLEASGEGFRVEMNKEGKN